MALGSYITLIRDGMSLLLNVGNRCGWSSTRNRPLSYRDLLSPIILNPQALSKHLGLLKKHPSEDDEDPLTLVAVADSTINGWVKGTRDHCHHQTILDPEDRHSQAPLKALYRLTCQYSTKAGCQGHHPAQLLQPLMLAILPLPRKP